MRARPANALTPSEQEAIVQALTSEDLVDRAPAQAYALLLEQGRYLGSVSTIYRVLRERKQVLERRRQARHPAKKRPELMADGPCQVFSWDITKLRSRIKGVYYDAYVMIDIYSRMIVGVHVHARENCELAAEMMREVFGVHGIPHVVHADRGTAMKSKSVTDLLQDLDIDPSYSRPKISNDNPYSEANFRTLKYSPWFPEYFTDLGHARQFMDDFAAWYNACHHHSGIGLLVPADVHYGRHHQVQATRLAALEEARRAHPERFSSGPAILPKSLRLPEQAWINKPEEPSPDPAAATRTKPAAA
ncbi:hypothetical protein GCM10027456_68070 [Kineosporia babensis]